MMITYQEVLAFVAGVGFTILGVWSAAVADRIRFRRLEHQQTHTSPPRMPQRREAREVFDALEDEMQIPDRLPWWAIVLIIVLCGAVLPLIISTALNV